MIDESFGENIYSIIKLTGAGRRNGSGFSIIFDSSLYGILGKSGISGSEKSTQSSWAFFIATMVGPGPEGMLPDDLYSQLFCDSADKINYYC